jgi:hypothetical protein
MDRIRRHVSYANVAATLALVLAMSGGAVAATGGFSSGGTLKACANEEGVIRLLKPGKKCKQGQKSVSWNQTGPAGASGAKGVSGAPGANGASGAAGSPGAPGLPASAEWASLSKEGAILTGRGAISATEVAGPTYEVTFDRDVSKCGAVATSNFTAAEPRTNVGSGGVVTVQLSVNSTPVAEAVTVAVFCP